MQSDGATPVLVGIVARAHGLRGEVVVDPTTDTPGRFDPGRVVAAGPDLTPEQVAAITADIEKLATSDAWKQELKTRGWDDRFLAGPEFQKQLAADLAAVKVILTDIGLVQ